MHPPGSQIITLVVILILSSMIMASGCAQIKDQISALTTSRDACTAEGNLPHHGSILLLSEAERQLALMNSSDYTHTTYVDEENGIYNYDCSGFVGYALYRADPCAISVLLHKGFNVRLHKRPDTGNFYYHLLHRARPRQWRLDEGLNPARTPSRGYHCLAETGLFRCE